MKHNRMVYCMDYDWRFRRDTDTAAEDTRHSAVYTRAKAGNASGPATKRAFDDSAWEKVNLPHDYIRESPTTPEGIGNHGFHVLCDGWYRKTFTVDSRYKGCHALLVFGGIATSSTIWLNGSVAERCFSGYSEIAIDVTDRLYYDRVNTLTVLTKSDNIEGWWYEGGGIYRHVYLYFKSPLHIAHNGVFAKPVLKDEAADEWSLETEVTLENSGYDGAMCDVRVSLWDGDTLVSEKTAAAECAADGKAVLTLSLPVTSPIRWDVDDPKLYTVKTELLEQGSVMDEDTVRTGFRTFRIDAEKGFFLNGRSLKLKGTCNHQDHAGVGVAVPDSIQYYRIRRLKEMGSNAYRCAHNPPARELLDACDELGMIVMDENRTFETRPDAMRNLEMLIRRDRNHPSVIFYSLFNEETIQSSAEGAAIYKRLKSLVKKLDDTRIFTGAINDNFHAAGAGAEMDVYGLNYDLATAEKIHAAHPELPLMGSENDSAFAVRGCAASDRARNLLSDRDEEKAPWGNTARENWPFVFSHDYFAGAFTWTGFDYRGEPSPFGWPTRSSLFGIMDTCGFAKTAYYCHQAFFTDTPMMHLFPHWNHTPGETVRVMTVTNCDEAELFLNGVSLGRRPSDPAKQNEWLVDFVPGTLSATGYKNGVPAAFAEVKTAGAPAAVKLIPDRTWISSRGQDTVPVRVSVTDKNGVEVPTADCLIRFAVAGDGILAGVGNGDPNSHDADHAPCRKLFNGLCQALVMADMGAKTLKLTASCEGLSSAEVIFTVKEETPPACIFFKPNREISGVLVSLKDSAEKPDPARTISDTDMNTFTPAVLESDFHKYAPYDFVSGWREFRIPVTLPKNLPEGQLPALVLQSVLCSKAEFYADGILLHEESPAPEASVTVPLRVCGKQEFEVRALLRACEGDSPANGISGGIRLSTVDK